MRRSGDLFEQIITRQNLSLAFWKAARGKRQRPSVRAFAANLDARLADLQHQLVNHCFEFGRYFEFTIWDPKERTISAPRFAERVAHHALFNVCEPILDRLAIPDTYACFRDRGQVKAIERAQQFSRLHAWHLKLDVRKYFDSISHDRLLQRLRQKFKDKDLLHLFEQIVRSYRAEVGHGLPIGALTSQHLANYYLGVFDRFVTQNAAIQGYVRYMDDMLLWSDDKLDLKRVGEASAQFLTDHLGLTLKHAQLNRSACGVPFLGLRVFPDRIRLGPRAKRNARIRYDFYTARFAEGQFTESEFQQHLSCLVAWLKNADTMEFRRDLFRGDGAELD